jgi:hypothetical protein
MYHNIFAVRLYDTYEIEIDKDTIKAIKEVIKDSEVKS